MTEQTTVENLLEGETSRGLLYEVTINLKSKGSRKETLQTMEERTLPGGGRVGDRLLRQQNAWQGMWDRSH